MGHATREFIKPDICQFAAFCRMLLTFKMITLFIVFCFVSTCSGNMGGSEANEPVFVLNFDSSVYVCPDEDSTSRVDSSAVEVVNFNETLSFLDGFIIFHQDIGLNTMALVVVEKEVSGQFEKIFTQEICDLCEELQPKSPYFKYLRYFGLPEECPVPAGQYPIHEFVPDRDDLPVTSTNAGRYQVAVTLFHNPDASCKNEKIFLLCFKFAFLIERLE